jgi:alpha-1,2-mannosyltransferase
LQQSPNASVCVGKEWYRFPCAVFFTLVFSFQTQHLAHFFLPLGAKLNFYEDGFHGQLPQHYGNGSDATSRIPPNMNNLNKEEPSRYVNRIQDCDFVVDWDFKLKTDDPFKIIHKRRFSQ